MNDDVHGNENRVNKRAAKNERERETIMKAVMPPPHYYLAIAINSILVTRLELATTMMLMMTMCER